MLRNKPLFSFFCCLFFYTQLNAQFDYNGMQELHVQRNQKLDPFLTHVTNSVTPVMFAVPIGSFSFWIFTKEKKYLKNTLMQLEAIAINGILTIAMKETFRRARPFETYSEFENLVPAGSFSFPSGHTSSAFNTATALTLSCPKWYLAVPSYTWAALAGYSRIHLGVHYPSDVIVGALVGSATAVGAYYLNNWLFSIKSAKQSKAQKL